LEVEDVRLAIAAALLSLSTTAAMSESRAARDARVQRLQDAPEIDIEKFPPGLEIPRPQVPKGTATSPRPLPQIALPQGPPPPRSMPPAPRQVPAVERSVQAPSPPVDVRHQPPLYPPVTQSAPPPPRRYGPPVGVPAIPVRIEPDPIVVIGAFVGAILTIIRATQHR
jgi:hypothetical protein